MRGLSLFVLVLIVAGCCHKQKPVEIKLEDAIIASRNALAVAQDRILFQQYVKYHEYNKSMGGDYFKIQTVKLNGANLIVTSSEWDPSLTGTWSATPSIGFTLGGKFSKSNSDTSSIEIDLGPLANADLHRLNIAFDTFKEIYGTCGSDDCKDLCTPENLCFSLKKDNATNRYYLKNKSAFRKFQFAAYSSAGPLGFQ